MRRLLSATALDLRLQWRYRLTLFSLLIGLLSGLLLRQLFAQAQRAALLPAYFVFVVGGTAILYAAAQYIFERDEGTLDALRVSPLRPVEYLTARTTALTLLMLLESVVVLAAAGTFPAQLPALVGGLTALAVLHVLIGMILIPSFAGLTDALLPITGLVLLLQTPALLLIADVARFPLILLPSAGPLLLLQGAVTAQSTADTVLAAGLTLGWCAAAAGAALLRLRRNSRELD
jgi:hypothetical protein